jgi:DNA-binding response OmpR family regulator
MQKILLVEDDYVLRESLSECLSSEGFSVLTAASLEEARNAEPGNFDLVLLDWMLPDGQGVEIVKELRHQESTVPVIILTARTDVIDKVLGLELGANDYITKPFEVRELIARIRVQLRTVRGGLADSGKRRTFLKSSGIELNLDSMEVFFRKEEVAVTKLEFALLRLFLENPDRVFSRDELLDAVWGMKYPTTRTVDMHICQLRQKIRADLFQTVHGMGYRFRPNPELELN